MGGRRRLLLGLVVLALVACAGGAASGTSGAPSGASAGSGTVAGGAAASGGTAGAGQASNAGAGAAPAAPPPRVALKYGLNTTTISIANMWATKEQGIFDKYGLDVELATLPADQIVAAIISGEIPMSHLAGTPLVSGVLAGADLAFYGRVDDKLHFVLYSRPEYTSVRDLRGKEIAITSRAGIVRRAGELILERNGLNPESDVTYVATGNLTNSMGALLSGNVAAALLAPPVSFRAEDEGMRLLVNTEDYDVRAILSGIAASRAWVDRNEDTATRVIQALAEGLTFSVRNKERLKEIAAKYLQTEDMALLERSYQAQVGAWDRGSLRVPPDAIRFDLETAAGDNPAARDARPEQFYDNRLIERLEQQGFFDRLAQQ